MDETSLTFFQDLLETPSPSGYEGPVQEIVRRYAAEYAEEVRTDVHGNVIACRNAAAPLRVMMAGHCDQIGLVLTQIDDKGFLYTQPIGGWDPQQLVGQRMTIWTRQGAVPAVIARKPIHLQNEQERKQVVRQEELWLDIGARTRDEATQIVRIGDPVTLQLAYQPLRNGFATAPGMDDKAGVWVVFEALRRAASRHLACALYAVSTVQEEIGLRGARTSAYGIDPHIGIAVDVTHATDCPTIDARQQGDIALGKGPVIFRGPNMNPVLTERLIDLAREHDINCQLAASGRATPNDANSLQVSRAGVATGLVSLPNRYMHSAVEMLSLSDLDAAAELLVRFLESLRVEDDFTP